LEIEFPKRLPNVEGPERGRFVRVVEGILVLRIREELGLDKFHSQWGWHKRIGCTL
jgi:hypothetical protein